MINDARAIFKRVGIAGATLIFFAVCSVVSGCSDKDSSKEPALAEQVEKALKRAKKFHKIEVDSYKVDEETRTVTLRGLRSGKYEKEKWEGKKVIVTGYAWRMEELVLSGIRKYDRERDGAHKRDKSENDESKENAALEKKYESELIVIENAVGKNVEYDGTGTEHSRVSIGKAEKVAIGKYILDPSRDMGTSLPNLISIVMAAGEKGPIYEAENLSFGTLRAKYAEYGEPLEWKAVLREVTSEMPETSGLMVGRMVLKPGDGWGEAMSLPWNAELKLRMLYQALEVDSYSNFDVDYTDITAPNGTKVDAFTAFANIRPREPFTLSIKAKGMRFSHKLWALATVRDYGQRDVANEKRISDKTFMEADIDLLLERLPAGDGSDVFRGHFTVNAKDGSSAKFAFSGKVPSGIYLRPSAVVSATIDRTHGGRVPQTIWVDHYTPKTNYLFEYLTVDINGKGAIEALLPRRFKKGSDEAYLFGDLLNLFLPAKVFLSSRSDFGGQVDANLRKLLNSGGKVTLHIKPQAPVPMKGRTFFVDDAPKEFGISTTYSPK